jgi:two-component system, OmpR family, response regulator
VGTVVAPRAPLDTSLVRWPREADLRNQLASLRQPRLLLVEAGQAPPTLIDELEDWIRSPSDHEELAARCQELRRRALAAARSAPEVDADGLLWVKPTWVAIPPTQVAVVSLLVAQIERVVTYDALTDAYAASGGSTHFTSVRTMLSRVASRVAEVGLELVTVRRRGVLLTQQPRVAR